MSNNQRPVVNQRLYFCRLHLDWLREHLDQQQLPRHVLEQALGESIVHHLISAYRAYLEEIAAAYKLAKASLYSAADLVEVLSANQLRSSEAEQLLLLEGRSGWLAELLSLDDAQAPMPNAARRSGAELISLTEVNADMPLSLTRLEEFFQHLNTLIGQQRNQLEEW